MRFVIIKNILWHSQTINIPTWETNSNGFSSQSKTQMKDLKWGLEARNQLSSCEEIIFWKFLNFRLIETFGNFTQSQF